MGSNGKLSIKFYLIFNTTCGQDDILTCMDHVLNANDKKLHANSF